MKIIVLLFVVLAAGIALLSNVSVHVHAQGTVASCDVEVVMILVCFLLFSDPSSFSCRFVCLCVGLIDCTQ